MDFGICFKGEMEPDRMKAVVRQAENAGFTYCWFYDSHILWRRVSTNGDVYGAYKNYEIWSLRSKSKHKRLVSCGVSFGS